jgi:hypothetical protein
MLKNTTATTWFQRKNKKQIGDNPIKWKEKADKLKL